MITADDLKKQFCKCWINVRKESRYIHRRQFESATVPNAFSVASAGRDERESRESRPGGETKQLKAMLDIVESLYYYYYSPVYYCSFRCGRGV